jgi:tripartite-type tricarboxylate transporter receptor subunit TctC
VARFRNFHSLLAVVWLVAGGCLAQAQTAASYPSRAITMIVPFPPGGPTDTYARMVAAKMQERWGQPVVVENKPGGTGVLGNNLVIKSPPNGYTLLFTSNSAHLISVLLKNPKPYDSIKDFTPISIAIKYPMCPTKGHRLLRLPPLQVIRNCSATVWGIPNLWCSSQLHPMCRLYISGL